MNEVKIERIEIWHPIDGERRHIVQCYGDDQIQFYTDGTIVACSPREDFVGEMGNVRFRGFALTSEDTLTEYQREIEAKEALMEYRESMGQRISDLEAGCEAWSKAFDYMAGQLAKARDENRILRGRLGSRQKRVTDALKDEG